MILTRTNAGAISIAIDYMLEYPDKRINLHNLDGLTNLVNTVRDISHLKKRQSRYLKMRPLKTLILMMN